ncbi:hypothetical protein XPA_009205 [Xanthoria parietina]
MKVDCRYSFCQDSTGRGECGSARNMRTLNKTPRWVLFYQSDEDSASKVTEQTYLCGSTTTDSGSDRYCIHAHHAGEDYPTPSLTGSKIANIWPDGYSSLSSSPIRT